MARGGVFASDLYIGDMAQSERSKKGFLGRAPEGILLDFQADLLRPMGVAFERCLNFQKETHAHDRVVICAARGATRAEIRDAKTGQIFINHSEMVVIKPAKFYHSVKSLTLIYEDLALLPTVAMVREVGTQAQFNAQQVEKFLAECRQIQRSIWLDQLLQQYFVRRLLQSAPAQQLEFLEFEILRELLLLTVGPPVGSDSRAYVAVPGSIQRVLELTEANLFTELSVANLARAAGMSQSSLLRLFKNALGKNPREYVRDRRLDEAHRMLEHSNRSVLEVAQLVGYSEASAFGRAYRARFAKSPRRN